MIFIFSILISVFNGYLSLDIDLNGYVMYCPCMGRFGNQADHFLGALGFARGLNRTLILPPWVEYRTGSVRSTQVPFDVYFQVEPLKEFHHVITMEKFMSQLAPTIWPPSKRYVFCYMTRENDDCKAKDGNPFGSFWDTFNVDFVKSEAYAPLHYDVHYYDTKKNWKQKYPPEVFPVLAFMGSPATFPVQPENRDLHRFLQWSDPITLKAKEFIKTILPKGPFIGIHLRNGADWERACVHVNTSPNLFAAPQCLGYQNEHGKATKELCLPSRDTIIKQLKKVVKTYRAASIFVASDNNFMISDLNGALKKLKAKVFRYEPSDPHVDLAILGLSNHFIGNCISSFSAFAKRQRDVDGLPSSFWAFPLEAYSKTSSKDRDEL